MQRLRSPRYALALIVSCVYFFFVFGGPALLQNPDAGQRSAHALSFIAQYFGAVLLSVIVAMWWLIGHGRNGIVLSPAEANLLVPSPITRRNLIHFKLLLAQPAILITAAVTTAVLRGSSLPLGLRFVSAWLLFSTLHLHQVGASLVHTAVRQLAFLAAFIAQVFAALMWLGRAYDRTDPVEAGLCR